MFFYLFQVTKQVFVCQKIEKCSKKQIIEKNIQKKTKKTKTKTKTKKKKNKNKTKKKKKKKKRVQQSKLNEEKKEIKQKNQRECYKHQGHFGLS